MTATTTATVILDSQAPDGTRLTTMEWVFPRFILAEVNTHRRFSRNSASSRALPLQAQIRRVWDDPFVPARFTSAQKGMQGGDALSTEDQRDAAHQWRVGAYHAAATAERLLSLGVHQQHAARILEPYLWHTALVSSTEWENFLSQRDSDDAQPEMQTLAQAVRAALAASEPRAVEWGGWHLPYVPDGCDDPMVSAGRCARVSYLQHDGSRDPARDRALAERLVRDGHWSPFEHVAQAVCRARWGTRNYGRSWRQYRAVVEVARG